MDPVGLAQGALTLLQRARVAVEGVTELNKNQPEAAERRPQLDH